MASEGRIPILGICLGMQLLADESEEHGHHKGLGLIPGRVVRLKESQTNSKVPNVGWCETHQSRPSSLFTPDAGAQNYYCVHSFHFIPDDEQHSAATMLLGDKEIVSAVEHANVAGVQFHPEKSQTDGLSLIARWAMTKGLLEPKPLATPT